MIQKIEIIMKMCDVNFPMFDTNRRANLLLLQHAMLSHSWELKKTLDLFCFEDVSYNICLNCWQRFHVRTDSVTCWYWKIIALDMCKLVWHMSSMKNWKNKRNKLKDVGSRSRYKLVNQILNTSPMSMDNYHFYIQNFVYISHATNISFDLKMV